MTPAVVLSGSCSAGAWVVDVVCFPTEIPRMSKQQIARLNR